MALEQFSLIVLVTQLFVNGGISQILLINEPTGGNEYCTSSTSSISTSTSCNITITGQCNANACFNTTYHCPITNNCQSCQIECKDKNICKYATIYSYSCNYLKVFTDSDFTSVMQQMTIYGPNGGNAYVYINSQTESFEGSKIISNKTNNINVEIVQNAGDRVARNMYIDGNDATGSVTLTCSHDCDQTTIICPQHDTNGIKNCYIDCSDVEGNYKCDNINIFSKYGMESTQVDCEIGDSQACEGSNIYCYDDSSLACSMEYSSNLWECIGDDNTHCENVNTVSPETNTNNINDEGENSDTDEDENKNSGGSSSNSGDDDNGLSDNTIFLIEMIVLISVISIIMLFCLCLIRYMQKNEDKYYWFYDWITHVSCRNCCKGRNRVVSGVQLSQPLLSFDESRSNTQRQLSQKQILSDELK